MDLFKKYWKAIVSGLLAISAIFGVWKSVTYFNDTYVTYKEVRIMDLQQYELTIINDLLTLQSYLTVMPEGPVKNVMKQDADNLILKLRSTQEQIIDIGDKRIIR